MATKKEKRAAAIAKREAMLAEVKADGLRAQARDQARQAQHREEIRKDAKSLNDRYNAILSRHGIHESNVDDATSRTDEEEIARAKRFAEAFVIGFEEGMTEE
jgi:hypothetical protein